MDGFTSIIHDVINSKDFRELITEQAIIRRCIKGGVQFCITGTKISYNNALDIEFFLENDFEGGYDNYFYKTVKLSDTGIKLFKHLGYSEYMEYTTKIVESNMNGVVQYSLEDGFFDVNTEGN